MPAFSALFFDIDDTLFSSTDFTQRARRNAVQAMLDAGLRIPFDEAHVALAQLIDEFGSNYEHHYDLLLERFGAESYAPINRAIIIAGGVIAYHDTKFRSLEPYAEVREVLQLLAASREARLGIISAGSSVKQAEKLLRLGLKEYFDPRAIFISEQIGIGKLNPELYRRACSELDIKPEHALHVGDHPRVDIDPANEAGLVTVLLNRGGKYASVQGKTSPRHTVGDFWDLLEILRHEYGFQA